MRSSLAVILLLVASTPYVRAQELPRLDYRGARSPETWLRSHDIETISPSIEGLVVRLNGGDPYTLGPMLDLPNDRPLWLVMTCRSEAGGGGQVFYMRQGAGANESDSVRFPLRKGEFTAVRLPLPALGRGARLRLDPPGSRGTFTLVELAFEERCELTEPQIAPRSAVDPGEGAAVVAVENGPTLRQDRDRFDVFSIAFGDRTVARGIASPPTYCLRDGRVECTEIDRLGAVTGLEMPPPAGGSTGASSGLRLTATFTDAHGVLWKLDRAFTVSKDAIAITSAVTANRDVEVLFHLPLALSLGRIDAPRWAVLPGVEFLGEHPSEASSSDLDLAAPAAWRKIPDFAALTRPEVLFHQDDVSIRFGWSSNQRDAGPLFDSPDRLFRTQGHLVGMVLPQHSGGDRLPGRLLPYRGRVLQRGETVRTRIVIAFERRSIWTSAPDPGGGFSEAHPSNSEKPTSREREDIATAAAARAARGLLDSKVRDGARFRHAWWPGVDSFEPIPAADAAVWMAWLSARADLPEALRERLSSAAREALAAVPIENRLDANVGHIRTPVAPLVFGGVGEALSASEARGRAAFARFADGGRVRHRPRGENDDWGGSHFADHANGLTAAAIVDVLEDALFSGNREHVEATLEALSELSPFVDPVPRGAQTWEIPLHTPDILAAAHLVRAHALAARLAPVRRDGKAALDAGRLLERAHAWARIGMTFVYTELPPDLGPIGRFATIPVLGATHRVAPNWIGLPVQWCGAVFADALMELGDAEASVRRRAGRSDPSTASNAATDRLDFERIVARGIAGSAFEQTWDEAEPDLQGLLPDSFELRTQARNAVAINPLTWLAILVRTRGHRSIYESVDLANGATVHAPGTIESVDSSAFTIAAWPKGECSVLVVGGAAAARVEIDGRPIERGDRRVVDHRKGRLEIRVPGGAASRLRLD